MTIDQIMQLALQHLQAGRLAEAEGLYRQVLAQHPNHSDALHLLGVTACQTGRYGIAAELIGQAVALRPDLAEPCNSLGNALLGKGDLNEAHAAYRQAIALRPNYPLAYSNLGAALERQGKPDEAIAAYRQAIALKPGYAQAYSNLGNVLMNTGELDEAIAAYRQAICFNPGFAPAHNNLANALKEKGELDEAIGGYRQAIALQQNYREAHSNLGNALKAQGRTDEAIAAYRRAIAIGPGHSDAHNNLGNTLRDTGRLDEAIAAYRRAIVLSPDDASHHSNLGNALKDNGQLDEAIDVLTQAVGLNPGLAEAHLNLALSLLAQSDFRQGWEEYEWRLQCKAVASPARRLSQPRWLGGALEGKTLLLRAEQGLGDTLQFIRYVPMVCRQGGTVIIECQRPLQRLLQSNSGGSAVVAQGEVLPHVDVHCPLLSLPRVFGTTPDTIPCTVPYLRADAQDAGKWQGVLAGHERVRKVGLAWAGSRNHPNDRNRSIALMRLAPLACVPGVRFISLQVGDATTQAIAPPPGMDLIDCARQLNDFADTAGLVANLDLVIAVDTSIAHLAGAMGKPVWLLLPCVSDWRWMLQREDSPWYPTLRLFRQKAPGEWDEVIERVANCLGSIHDRVIG